MCTKKFLIYHSFSTTKVSLLDLYLFSERLKNKRKNIQRKAVFSKPVTGLSLKQIAESDQIVRTDVYTDESERIENLRDVDEDSISKFNIVGYDRLSDIANTDIRQISNEVDLPWRAIKEIKHRSQSHRGFSFNPVEDTKETRSQEEAVQSIINSEVWISIFLFEYHIRSICKNRAESILEENGSNLKGLIDEMYDNKRRATSYTGKIAKFTGCSEDYVKDVLSGRIDEGLTTNERNDILQRDDYKCQMCGSEDELEIHHIIPVSKGGNKEDHNLCTLCHECHIDIAHGGKTSNISYETKEEFWNKVRSSD